MTSNMSLSERKFFISTSHECGYLPDATATSLVADPQVELDTEAYSQLIQLGFRRSGDIVYRPHCSDCSECIPIRVPTDAFSPSRSQRRLWKKNDDLKIKSLPCEFHEEHYQMYRRYQSARHAGGSMDVDDRDRYISFFTADGLETRLVEFRHNNELLCVAVLDWLPVGLSAVYTFFDPGHNDRGLGAYAILWQIMRARDIGVPHVYLGYWIRDCDKMSYKNRYHPYELFIDNRWLRT